MNRQLARWYPLLLVLVVVLLLLYQILWAPNSFENDRVVTVSRGMAFKHVVDSLAASGVIRNRLLFEVAGEFLGKTREIRVGRYLFRPGVSNKAILDDLTEGKAALISMVTVREGIRAVTQARVFQRDLGTDSARFAGLVFNPDFVRSLGIDALSLEGYLLPETYLFYWQTDEETIIRQMVEEFNKFYVDSLQRRAKEMKMTTSQVLALASIVEGETSLESERAIVAGVYHNRLRRRMHLNADPTIQYVIPGGPRRLWYKDLKLESPYNTYRHYGLPPGPVNNPGRASILATLYPAKHRYLYFVASGRGGHVFSKTYSEHQRAVYRYRRTRARLSAQSSVSVQ